MINIVKLMALTLLLGVFGCSHENNNKVSIRLAHTLDLQHPVHQSLVQMNEVLKDISQGQMELIIYPSGQLGSEREIIELIQIGTMGMTKVSASSLEAFVPEMKVFSLPYLFRDHAHFWQVLDGDLGQKLLESGTAMRIKGLGYYDAGSRSFYTTKDKVHQPSDLAGLKIRVMNSQSAVQMVNTMGGAATPVNWGELYTALQQGIVEGAENNPPSFYYSKHYEVSKYYLLDEHTSIPDVIIIGTHMWNKLTKQQRTWLSEAMRQSSKYQRNIWAESTKMSLQKVAEAGVEILRADKALFKRSVQPIYDQVQGTPLADLVDEITEVGVEQ